MRPFLTATKGRGGITNGLAFLLLLIGGSTATAETPSSGNDRLADELAAGEFSAVRQAASELGDSVQRDQLLERLAIAQARSGSTSGTAESIRAILDPSIRQRTIGAVGAAISGNLAGGTQADFDSLIELITTTISPLTWDLNGGPGSISEYANGVFVDTQGVMRRVVPTDDHSAALQSLLNRGRAVRAATAARDVRQPSELRYVSLPRLEREIELRRLSGQPIDESMQVLAGLARVRYVFVYPETGDLVVAGPAGDWREEDGRVVSVESGSPVVRLEDLIVLMRRARQSGGPPFGCSIIPKQENLARTQEYLAATTARPLRPGERNKWVAGIRDALGRQEISVFGLDPRTRVARVLVEADYHMKLVGMGLAEGVPSVESYLATVPLGPNQPPQPMSVLRWWFALNYKAIAATGDRLAFELIGPGVRVLSENELLTERGERVHTGASDELTARFAASFTEHFADLARKYPVYAELRNVFDLALVAALCEEHDLFDQANWNAAALLDPGRVPIAHVPPPREVESVVNHRVVGDRYIVVGVSGGVSIDTNSLVAADALQVDEYGQARQNHQPLPRGFGGSSWWWDK